ncbi:MAG: response regulator [Tatlockia sp.]|nr:response regulator [Tatlockia sp.]
MKVQQPKTSLKPEEIAKTNAKAFVLIVEDNRAAGIAIKSCLNHSNCASDHAENGAMALQLVQNNIYDLILMDIGLPDIEGIEVTRQIRAFNTPYTSEVPIIAVTGHANESEKKEEALAAGMQAVFSKPLTLPKLETLLDQYIIHRKEEAELSEQQAGFPEKSNEVIDWEACVKNMNGDEVCVRELLSMLSSDLKLSQETMAKLYAAHDDEALRKELHRVRGGVAYLRLPQLDKALAQFHEAVKVKPQNIKQLVTTYSQLQEAMEAFWKTWEKKAF